MKTDPLYYAPEFLSPEDDQPLASHEQAAPSSDFLMEEMEIRAGLCAALSDMSSSTRALLGLMGRHNCITVLPDANLPIYERIMGRLGSAVQQGVAMVERSRNLDRRITLSCLPASNVPRQ